MSKAPAKRAKKAAAPEVPVSTLVARCTREALEGLIESKIASGRALERADLLGLLPETHHSAVVVVPRREVTTGAVREGTGFFDPLDEEVLEMILTQLPLRVRLTCCIAVCKAWRGLRDNPRMWASLEVEPYYRYRASGGGFDTNGLLRLVGWLRDVATVKTFSVETHDQISPDAVKKALTKLDSAKPPRLEKLHLEGKKITDACLTHIAKLQLCGSLTSLSLDVKGSVHSPAAIKLLGAMPKLRELKVPTTLASIGIFRALSDARGGGFSLVTHLRIDSGFGDSFSWRTLRQLADVFPELEELHAKDISDHHYGNTGSAPMHDMRPLPRLRVLKFNQLCGFTCHEKTEVMSKSITTLLNNCPALEELKLRHGVMWTGGSQPREMQPLPGLGGALQYLPAGLTSLELGDWILDGEDALPELPKLRKVKLKNCSERNAKPGPWSAADEQKKRADNEAFLRALRASAPLLTEENCKVDLTKTRG